MSKYNCIERLLKLNITWDDAHSLRRIAMTLQRVHELECGASSRDFYFGASWSLVRGILNKDKSFTYDEDNGSSYLEIHPNHGKMYYQKVPDRERGAHKRLEAIMAKYPELIHYIQGDPRGAPLYIMKRADIEERKIDECYDRGVAVCK